MRSRPTPTPPTLTTRQRAAGPHGRAPAADHGTSRVLLAAVGAGAVLAWTDVPGGAVSTALPTTATEAVLTLATATRWAALAICAYVVGVTALSLVGHRRRSHRLTRLADRLAVPALRKVLRTSAGTAVGIGLLLPGAALADPSPGPAPTATSAPAARRTDGPGPIDRSEPPSLELLDPSATEVVDTRPPTLVLLDGPQHPATDADEVEGAATAAPSPDTPTPMDSAAATGSSSTAITPPGPSPTVPDVRDRPPAPTTDGRSTPPVTSASSDPTTPAPPADATLPGTTAPARPDAPTRAGDPPAPSPTDQLPTSTGSPDHPTAPSPTSPPGAPRIWTIQPGEHLWLVAERVVEAAGGDPDDVATVARYHQRLISTNRHRLPVPEDPDLVLPGMVVDCPPVAA